MGLRGCRALLSYWRLQHAVAYSQYETYWPAALLETSGCQSREGQHALPAVGLLQRRGAQQAPKATWSSVSIVSLPVSRQCCSNTKGPSDTNGSSQSHSYGQKKSCDIPLPLSSILISPSLCAAERLVHRLAMPLALKQEKCVSLLATASTLGLGHWSSFCALVLDKNAAWDWRHIWTRDIEQISLGTQPKVAQGPLACSRPGTPGQKSSLGKNLAQCQAVWALPSYCFTQTFTADGFFFNYSIQNIKIFVSL